MSRRFAQRNFKHNQPERARAVELGLACGVVFEAHSPKGIHLSRDDRLYQKMYHFSHYGKSCILVNYTTFNQKSKGEENEHT